MDQHARHRSRGIRTIGRLAAPAAEDVLLAQWPLPADPAMQRQDVAVASAWTAQRPTRQSGRAHLLETDPISLCERFHHHQRRVLDRLLAAIELELTAGESVALVFEPPPTLQEDLLGIVRAATGDGHLSADTGCQLSERLTVVGESVARLWALIELYRGDLISATELRTKRDAIERDLLALPSLLP